MPPDALLNDSIKNPYKEERRIYTLISELGHDSFCRVRSGKISQQIWQHSPLFYVMKSKEGMDNLGKMGQEGGGKNGNEKA